MADQRFPIRIDPLWRLLLLIGGATPDNSYIELTDEALTVNFGRIFRETFARSDIEDASARDWPFWMGVGWRTNFLGRIGLIGSYDNVVEVRFTEPSRVWTVFSCKSLAFSLQDPDGFLEALGAPAAVAAA